MMTCPSIAASFRSQPTLCCQHTITEVTKTSLRSNRLRNGFTLVELLAVIAVLCLLIAMLMPSLGQAKELAIRSQCMSNMRQMHLLTVQYSSDYSGWVVPASQRTVTTVCNNSVATPCSNPNHFKRVYDGGCVQDLPANKPHSDGGSGCNITWDEAVYFNSYGEDLFPGHGSGGTNGGAGFLAYDGSSIAPQDRGGSGYSHECKIDPRKNNIIKAAQCPKGPWGTDDGELNDPNTPANDRPYWDWIPARVVIPFANTSSIGHYNLNMHQAIGSTFFTGATYSMGYYGTTPVGIRTSNWGDPAGTIFMQESWRKFGFTHSWGNNIHYSGGPFAAWAATLDPVASRTLWQEKHAGRANLVFCDGHVESLPLSATTGTGAKLTDADFTPRNAKGMWTHAQGD